MNNSLSGHKIKFPLLAYDSHISCTLSEMRRFHCAPFGCLAYLETILLCVFKTPLIPEATVAVEVDKIFQILNTFSGLQVLWMWKVVLCWLHYWAHALYDFNRWPFAVKVWKLRNLVTAAWQQTSQLKQVSVCGTRLATKRLLGEKQHFTHDIFSDVEYCEPAGGKAGLSD